MKRQKEEEKRADIFFNGKGSIGMKYFIPTARGKHSQSDEVAISYGAYAKEHTYIQK